MCNSFIEDYGDLPAQLLVPFLGHPCLGLQPGIETAAEMQ